MADMKSISELLSYSVVAFTIELDNEFEHSSPHRTSLTKRTGDRSSPWLASFVMWTTCLRYLNDEGLTVAELAERARATTNVDGVRRWGYVTVDQPPGAKSRRSAWILRTTAKGGRAGEVWSQLPARIEIRWKERFGGSTMKALRDSLAVVNSRLSPALPDFLPILGGNLVNQTPGLADGPIWQSDAWERSETQASPLFSLLARPLLAIALEYERRSDLSLAVSANLIRVLDPAKPVRVRDLPGLSGVSKEALSMAMGVARRRGLVVETVEQSAPQVRLLSLTTTGVRAQRQYHQTLADIQAEWAQRFGAELVSKLRVTLAGLAGDGTRTRSPLFGGLTAYTDSWRATVRQADLLPDFPMVLHRGGYPDGS